MITKQQFWGCQLSETSVDRKTAKIQIGPFIVTTFYSRAANSRRVHCTHFRYHSIFIKIISLVKMYQLSRQTAVCLMIFVLFGTQNVWKSTYSQLSSVRTQAIDIDERFQPLSAQSLKPFVSGSSVESNNFSERSQSATFFSQGFTHT